MDGERSWSESHDEQEVEEAALALSGADLRRLRSAARGVLRTFGIDPRERDQDDLLSEVLVRTLSGSRKWKRGVDFLYHLTHLMRSVAWTWRERQQSRRRAGPPRSVETVLAAAESDGAEVPRQLVASGIDAEATVLVEEKTLPFRRHFDGDRAALAVMDGWAEGCKPREIRRQTRMSSREYDAAARRIRRFAQQGDSDGFR